MQWIGYKAKVSGSLPFYNRASYDSALSALPCNTNIYIYVLKILRIWKMVKMLNSNVQGSIETPPLIKGQCLDAYQG